MFEDFIDLDVSVAGKVAEYMASVFISCVSIQTYREAIHMVL